MADIRIRAWEHSIGGTICLEYMTDSARVVVLKKKYIYSTEGTIIMGGGVHYWNIIVPRVL